MSYTVELHNGKQIVIEDEIALKLSKSIYENPKGMVTINKELVNKSSIANIYRGGKTEVDVIPESKRIAPPDNRGKESPAKNAIQEYLQAHGTMRGYRAN